MQNKCLSFQGVNLTHHTSSSPVSATVNTCGSHHNQHTTVAEGRWHSGRLSKLAIMTAQCSSRNKYPTFGDQPPHTAKKTRYYQKKHPHWFNIIVSTFYTCIYTTAAVFWAPFTLFLHIFFFFFILCQNVTKKNLHWINPWCPNLPSQHIRSNSSPHQFLSSDWLSSASLSSP